MIIYKALQIPLHIGVVVFVLISGYFTIKPSSKGLLKFLAIFLVYSLPELFYNIVNSQSIKTTLYSLLFISKTHFWFVKTYLYLYLISPILNLWIKKSTEKQQLYLLLALFFVSIYMGSTLGDDSLYTGKNLTHFVFIYLLGNRLYNMNVNAEGDGNNGTNEIKVNSGWNKWSRLSLKFWLSSYLLLNVCLTLLYYYTSEQTLGKLIWHLSFPYCSPIIILNAILFFMVFAKLDIKSAVVNWLAKSCLSIYLIHENRPYVTMLIGIATVYGLDHIASPLPQMMYLLVLALFVMIGAIIIDKLLFPVWIPFGKLGDILVKKLGF